LPLLLFSLLINSSGRCVFLGVFLMPLHGLPYFTPVVFSQKFTIPKTVDNLTIESGKLASAAERGAGTSNRMKLHSHTVIPPPAAGWFTSTLAVAQSPRGHRRHVVTGSKPANSAASASSASLCFHAKLPAKLAFVPYPWASGHVDQSVWVLWLVALQAQELPFTCSHNMF